MKSMLLMTALCLALAGCRFTEPPSARVSYRLACDALSADPSIPSGAVPHPIGQAGLYLAKNAGCVVLPYDVESAAGGTETRSYTVWVKRVARTWQVERAGATPVYSGDPS